MKKIVVILLIAALALSLTGCAATASAAAPKETAATAEETPAKETPEEGPDPAAGRLTVTILREKEEYYSDDGSALVLRYACAAPTVTIPGRESAQAAINAALEEERLLFAEGGDVEGLSGVEDYLSAAREDPRFQDQDAADYAMAYQLEREAEVTRGDSRVLSVAFVDCTYQGGAHGYAFHWAVNFDTLTGEKLALTDLAEDGEKFLEDAADRLFHVATGAEYAMRGFFEDYAETLPGLLRDGNWYFSDEGLVVIANAYEIGPYAAGSFEFTLPWGWLRWRVKPEYVPESAADGKLLGEIRDEAPADADYYLDDGTDGQGAAVVFTARGRVENVSLTRVGYSEYDDSFWPEGMLWYASALEDGETLCLRTWIPEILPDLALTRTEAAGIATDYISMSGKDGSLVLMDARNFLSLPAEIFDKVPVSRDLDGDGTKETVDLRHTLTQTNSQWEVLVDGKALPGALNLWGECQLWLTDVDYDGVIEIFLSGDLGSDDYATRGWRGDTRKMILFTGEDRFGKDPSEQTETVDGRVLVSGGTPVLESWTYRLGTYYSVRALRLGEDGVMAPADGSRWEFTRNRRWLTVEKNLPVMLDELGRAVLLPGEKIRLTSAEGNAIHFVTDEGETGALQVEYTDGDAGRGWYIDGVREDDCFDFLPYAG